MAKSGTGNIKVGVRMRPTIPREAAEPLRWKCQDNRIHRIDPDTGKVINSLDFDKVYDATSTNSNIFSDMVEPLIKKAVEGFNATILAYGQTSSGKTHTMMGNGDDQGIVPLCMGYIFDAIDSLPDERCFLLGVSFLEVYNEKVRDLLNPENTDLKIQEEIGGGIKVNCKTEMVNNSLQMLQLMEQGNLNKAIGETNMNERSSRSHTIFRIVIESQDKATTGEQSVVCCSQINLVDLAGSERASATGATGQRYKEGCAINRSLLQLGNVVQKLSDDKGEFIDYRSSKLTRILQPSLSGNANIAMICNITPVMAEQTQCTLTFASRASTIKLAPHLNEVMDDATLIKRHSKKIKELEKKLQNAAQLEEKNQTLEKEIEKLREMLVVSKFTLVAIPEERDRALRRQTWGGNLALIRTRQLADDNLALRQFPAAGLYSHELHRESTEPVSSARSSTSSSWDLSSEEQPSTMSIETSLRASLTPASLKGHRASLDSVMPETPPRILRMRIQELQKLKSSGTPPSLLREKIKLLQGELSQLGSSSSTSPAVLRERLGVLTETSTPVSVLRDRLEAGATLPGTPSAVLKQRLEKLEEQVNALEKEYLSLQEFTTLERQCIADAETKLRSEKESLQHTLTDYEQLCLETKRRNAQLEDANAELMEKVTQLENNMKSLQKELETNKAWSSKTNEQQLLWKKELVECKEKLTVVTNQSRDWQDEKDILKSRFEAKLIELQDSLTQSWAEQDALRAELATKSAEDNCQSSKDILDSKLQAKLIELQESLTQSLAEQDALRAELATKSAEDNCQSSKDRDILDNKLQAKLIELQDNLTHSLAEQDALRAELATKSAEDNCQSSKDILDSKLQAKLIQLQDNLTQSLAEQDALRAELATKSAEDNSIKTEEECEALRLTLMFKNQEIENLNTQIERNHEALQYSNTEMERLKEELALAKRNRSKLETHLEHKEEAHVKELQSLKNQIEELSAKKINVSFANVSVQDNLLVSEERKNNLLEQIEILTQKKEELSQQLELALIDYQQKQEEFEANKLSFRENMNAETVHEKEMLADQVNLLVQEKEDLVLQLQSAVEDCKQKEEALEANALQTEQLRDQMESERAELIAQLQAVHDKKQSEVFEFQHDSLTYVGRDSLSFVSREGQDSLSFVSREAEEERLRQEMDELKAKLSGLQEQQTRDETPANDSFSLLQLGKENIALQQVNARLTEKLNNSLDIIKLEGLLPELAEHLTQPAPQIEKYIANQIRDLQNTKDQMESDLLDLSQEVQHLKADNLALISKLEEAKQKMKDDDDLLTKQISLLNEQLEEARKNQKNSNISEFEPSDAVCFSKKVIQEICGLNKNFTSKELRHKSLQELHDIFVQSVMEKQSEVFGALQHEIQSLKSAKGKLQHQLSDVQAEVDKNSCDLNSAQKREHQLREDLNSLKLQMENLTMQHSRKVSELQNVLQQAQEQVQVLEKMLDEAQQNQDVDHLKISHNQKILDLENLHLQTQKQVKKLEEKLKEAQQSQRSDNLQLEESENLLLQAQQRIQELEEILKETLAEIEKSKIEPSQKISSLENQLKQATHRVQELEAQHNPEVLTTEASLQERVSEMEAALQAARERATELECRVTELRQREPASPSPTIETFSEKAFQETIEHNLREIEDLKSELAVLENSMKVSKSHASSLEIELSEVKQRSAEQVANMSSEFKINEQQLNSKITDLEETLEVYKQKIIESENELQQLKEAQLLNLTKLEESELQIAAFKSSFEESQQQITNLTDEIKQQQENCKGLLRDLNECEQQKSELELSFNEEAAKLQRLLDNAHFEASNLKQDLMTTNNQACEMRARETELQNSIENLEDKHSQTLVEFKQLQNLHSNCKQMLEQMQSQIVEKEAELSVLREERAELQDSNVALASELNLMSISYDKVSTQLECLQETARQFELLEVEHSNCKQLHLQLQQAREKETEYETQNTGLQSKLSSLCSKYENIESEYTMLKEEFAKSREIILTLQKAENFNEELRVQISSQQKIIEGLQLEVESVVGPGGRVECLEQELQSSQSQCAEAQACSSEAGQRLQTLALELQAQSSMLTSLQHDLTKSNTKLNSTTAERDVLKQKLNEAEAEIKAQNVKLEEAEEEFQDMLKEYRVNSEKRNLYEGEAYRLELEAAKLNNKIADLEVEIAELKVQLEGTQDVESLRQTLIECQKELHAKSAQLAEVQRTAADSGRAAAQFEAEVIQLRKDVADQRGEIAVINRRLRAEDLPHKNEAEMSKRKLEQVEKKLHSALGELRHLQSVQHNTTFQECYKCRRTKSSSHETQTSPGLGCSSVAVQAPPDNAFLYDRRDGFLPTSAITEAGRMYGMKQQLADAEGKLEKLQRERGLFKEELRKRNRCIQDLQQQLKQHDDKENHSSLQPSSKKV